MKRNTLSLQKEMLAARKEGFYQPNNASMQICKQIGDGDPQARVIIKISTLQ